MPATLGPTEPDSIRQPQHEADDYSLQLHIDEYQLLAHGYVRQQTPLVIRTRYFFKQLLSHQERLCNTAVSGQRQRASTTHGVLWRHALAFMHDDNAHLIVGNEPRLSPALAAALRANQLYSGAESPTSGDMLTLMAISSMDLGAYRPVIHNPHNLSTVPRPGVAPLDHLTRRRRSNEISRSLRSAAGIMNHGHHPMRDNRHLDYRSQLFAADIANGLLASAATLQIELGTDALAESFANEVQTVAGHTTTTSPDITTS